MFNWLFQAINLKSHRFLLAFVCFSLFDFNRDFFRLITSNCAAISETVEQPFNRAIIRVETAFSGNDKADKKAFWSFFFAFILRQWFIASKAFHDWHRIGITILKIGSNERIACFWKSAPDFI